FRMATNPIMANPVAITTATITSGFNVFSNLFANNGVTLINVALIVATIGGQSLLKKISFNCPCAYPLNVYQSLMFLLGPSFALLVIGFMINSTTWRLMHGCCYRHRDTRHSVKTAFVYWVEVLVQASVAPAAWLFVAFLDGSYYTCLLAADFCHLDTAPQCFNSTWRGDTTSWKSMSGDGKYCPLCICGLIERDKVFLESTSNIIAWGLLICYGSAAFLCICCVRMCDKYTMIQRKYIDTYKGEESKQFENIAREHAAQIADNNARAFFSNQDWSKKDWDWVSGVSEISNPFFARIRYIAEEKTKTTLYTPLQLWSSHQGYKILKPDVEAPTLVEDGDHPQNMNA
ncbi:hypothetical protein PFISCL1PPCAC_7063, partial [Pristionchus fissidentatus]